MSVAECLKNKEPPTLQRKDLMSFSTINSNDAPMKNFKKLHTSRDWSLNLYNLDIDKSTPKKISIYSDKIDFINKNDDIEKSTCAKEHPFLNKKCFSLTNLDIEKSTPNSILFKTNRNTNPLMPVYKFPKGEECPPEIPKFIRDNINIDDIKCAHPKNYSDFKRQLSENLFTLENAKIRKGFNRKTKYEYIDYSDLKDETFKTTRCTNPLDPVYNISYKNSKGDGYDKFTYGFIEKSKPQSFSRFIMNHNFNLRNDDIYGSNVGSKNTILKFQSNNGYWNIQDIKGTNTGSLKRGIDTKRKTNPLWPRYAFPGNNKLEFCNSLSNNFFNSGNAFYKSSSCKNFNSPEIKLKNNFSNNINNSSRNNNTKDTNIKSIDNKNDKISTSNNCENGIDENNNNEKIKTYSPAKEDNSIRQNIDKNKEIDENKGDIDKINNIQNEDNIINNEMQFNKFQIPNYYGLKHDKYLQPFSGKEENKKDSGPTTTQKFLYNKIFENKKLNLNFKQENDKLNKDSLSPKFTKTPNFRIGGPLTYTEKLDLFMSKNNLKLVKDDNHNKNE